MIFGSFDLLIERLLPLMPLDWSRATFCWISDLPTDVDTWLKMFFGYAGRSGIIFEGETRPIGLMWWFAAIKLARFF